MDGNDASCKAAKKPITARVEVSIETGSSGYISACGKSNALSAVASILFFISGPIKNNLETDGYKKLSAGGTSKMLWAKVFEDPDDATKLLKGNVNTARSKCRRLVYKYDSCHMSHD